MGFVLGVILRIRLPTDAVLFQNSHYPKVIVPASVDEKVLSGEGSEVGVVTG